MYRYLSWCDGVIIPWHIEFSSYTSFHLLLQLLSAFIAYLIEIWDAPMD